MKLIGAGLPRTATLTQKIALEMLGQGPCYHMVNILTDLSQVQQWIDAFDGSADWDKVFAGHNATVDWPSAYFYTELMQVYPDAKVLLSVRDPESWARSMENTIWGCLYGDTLMRDLSAAQARVNPGWAKYLELVTAMWTKSGLLGEGDFDTTALAAAFDRYNDEVRATVPPEKLLVWSAADGWEPLCEFLGVPVPPAPLPRVNDSGMFAGRIIEGSMMALNAWQDEQKAASAQQ
jgi:Sulfotransferase domain